MSGYKKYKEKLREEFIYTCVYCGIREPELGGSQSFHIDHYKPQKKFPKLINRYSNLLYACRNCNQYKKDYWPTFTQKLMQHIVLNPRQEKDKRELHIDTNNFAWKGTTEQGKWNIKKLRLDSKTKIKQREERSQIENIISKLENERNDLFQRLQTLTDPQDIQQFEHSISDLESMISTLKNTINGRKD